MNLNAGHILTLAFATSALVREKISKGAVCLHQQFVPKSRLPLFQRRLENRSVSVQSPAAQRLVFVCFKNLSHRDPIFR